MKRKPKSRAIINCDMCGVEMDRIGSRINPENFCSLECRHAYRRGGVIVNDDLIKELLKLKKDGWTNKLIAEFFEIGIATVAVLYRKHKK